MMARVRIYVLALAVVVSLVGFVRESRGDNVRPASQVYRRYCISCHGSDGKAKTSKGKYSHARDLTDAQWQGDVSDERIFNSIMNGRNQRGNMPAFADKINEKEVNSLVNFVRGLRAQ
ncbi:MAG TPA: cytochrome c [Pyrinomonadaceae bacterium]|nr:cytochrome c [Pyrinomonadaceae bacterium]